MRGQQHLPRFFFSYPYQYIDIQQVSPSGTQFCTLFINYSPNTYICTLVAPT